jgi:hypothetical protein
MSAGSYTRPAGRVAGQTATNGTRTLPSVNIPFSPICGRLSDPFHAAGASAGAECEQNGETTDR